MDHAIGTRVGRLDGPDKSTGRTAYAADLSLPRMLTAKLLLSPHPHARILKVDAGRARAMPGVVSVLTHEDVPRRRHGMMIHDEWLFAADKVRYVGDIVAAVAAETSEAAEEALQRIDVTYEELPAVFDPEDALRAGAPVLHEGRAGYSVIPLLREHFQTLPEGNLCWRVRIEAGEAGRAFERAEIVVSGEYEAPMGQGCPLETKTVVARPEGKDRVTLWTASQVPFHVRHGVAEILGLPASSVRVIAPPIGGGFGSKSQVWLEPQAAILALAAGRPVKLELTREEEFCITQPRHPARVQVRSAVDRTGVLQAREVRALLDTGFSAMEAPVVASLAAMTALGPYRIPNVSVEVSAVYTNKPSASSVRAPSAPQTVFAVESHTDAVAEELGMDPLAFRLKNIVRTGEAGPTGQALGNVGLEEALKAAAEAIGWSSRESLPPGRGRGLALNWWLTAPFGCGAVIKLNEDGSAALLTGAVDHGAGATAAVLPQIVAEELGIPVERVRVVQADTETTPHDYGAVGSRTTFNQGNAVRLAARDARRQILELASARLEAAPGDLAIDDGRIHVQGHPDRSVSLGDLLSSTAFGAPPVVGKGTFRSRIPRFGREGLRMEGSVVPVFSSPSFGVQAVEVEVDSETGAVTVHRIVGAQDVGRALNPSAVEGQMEGGIVQGIGIALMEESLFDGGVIVNPTLIDFKLPVAMDVPIPETVLIEAASEDGPYGAKGVGEPPVIPTAGAIANAVRQAAGVRVRRLPMTAERVFRAMREKGRTGDPAF